MEPPALTIAAVIGSPNLGRWCEEYITWLRSRDVGWASIANYTNSLYSLLNFVATSDDYELTLESGFTCFDMLANLRRQAHGHASTDKMYRKRDVNWMVSGVNTDVRIRPSKHKVILLPLTCDTAILTRIQPHFDSRSGLKFRRRA